MDRTENQHLQFVVKGNQPLLLDDPQKVWLIESGSIALFAVKIKDGIPDGARRYLFSLEAGEALFGMSANRETYSLLAASVETAIVRQLSTCAGGTRGQGDKGDNSLRSKAKGKRHLRQQRRTRRATKSSLKAKGAIQNPKSKIQNPIDKGDKEQEKNKQHPAKAAA